MACICRSARCLVTLSPRRARGVPAVVAAGHGLAADLLGALVAVGVRPGDHGAAAVPTRSAEVRVKKPFRAREAHPGTAGLPALWKL